jgi:hypothetical protein
VQELLNAWDQTCVDAYGTTKPLLAIAKLMIAGDGLAIALSAKDQRVRDLETAQEIRAGEIRELKSKVYALEQNSNADDNYPPERW